MRLSTVAPFRIILYCAFFVASSLLAIGYLGFSGSLVHADTNVSFYPTWKILKPTERKLFVSGYLQGWRDSRRVIEIVKMHIEENPDKAVASLEKIRKLYGTADLPVDGLIEQLTKFYSDPENQDAPLSVAVSASR
ncbi:MAG: hypothetical protein KDD70_17470 [Bdellovibrionales bacterium]|nr:hypothetical protein [Bdellovibrionales bacterium]